ncbi:MAG: hypothetical protein E6Q97_06735 [Desulfurellales bacterium]|nr:MAG: hypothetical protein E6Q97_06735 [Desulfurellales bacterium]
MDVNQTAETKYPEYQKIKRLNRDCSITEKIDGTNALILVSEDGTVKAGQRTKWVPWPNGPDNYGFAQWVEAHKEELRQLGPGLHRGEWFGAGIQRGYGLTEKRFALFLPPKDGLIPACCSLVPTLYKGPFSTETVANYVEILRRNGSVAVPGYMNPEGVVVFHEAIGFLAKVTLQNDDKPKGAP